MIWADANGNYWYNGYLSYPVCVRDPSGNYGYRAWFKVVTA